MRAGQEPDEPEPTPDEPEPIPEEPRPEPTPGEPEPKEPAVVTAGAEQD
jgi:hypothetical protein